MPYGFNHEDNVACTIVDVPQVSSGSFQGLAVCVFYRVGDPCPSSSAITIEDKDFSHHHRTYLPGPYEDYEKSEFMWVSCWRTPSLVNECNRFSIKVETDGFHFPIVKRIGFRLLSEKELDLVADVWGKPTWIDDMHPNANIEFLNSIALRNRSEGWGWEWSTIQRCFT
ncbi:hypothetical protein SLE2022_328060 [Rubroshorea leprosula]